MNRPIFSRKKKKTAARDLNFWMMLFGDLLVQVAVEWNIGQDAAVRHAWELLSGKDWDESAVGARGVGITKPHGSVLIKRYTPEN